MWRRFYTQNDMYSSHNIVLVRSTGDSIATRIFSEYDTRFWGALSRISIRFLSSEPCLIWTNGTFVFVYENINSIYFEIRQFTTQPHYVNLFFEPFQRICCPFDRLSIFDCLRQGLSNFSLAETFACYSRFWHPNLGHFELYRSLYWSL